MKPSAALKKPTTNPSLKSAVGMLAPDKSMGDAWAQHFEAAIRSAVRAVLPGRQQKKNLDPLMAAAVKAAARTLRRRARSRG